MHTAARATKKGKAPASGEEATGGRASRPPKGSPLAVIGKRRSGGTGGGGYRRSLRGRPGGGAARAWKGKGQPAPGHEAPAGRWRGQPGKTARGTGTEGASFGGLRWWAEDIRPQFMARHSALSFHVKDLAGRNPAPLKDGGRRYPEAARQFAGAAYLTDSFFKCVWVTAHAHL